MKSFAASAAAILALACTATASPSARNTPVVPIELCQEENYQSCVQVQVVNDNKCIALKAPFDSHLGSIKVPNGYYCNLFNDASCSQAARIARAYPPGVPDLMHATTSHANVGSSTKFISCTGCTGCVA